MNTNTGSAKVTVVAMMASIFLAACGSVPNEENRSSQGTSRPSSSPHLKPDYPCQNMHVRLPSCPSR
jgi:uncharacterized lipoprotein